MNTEQMSPRDKLKEDARSLCRMEAMARFRIADEDMTPVIQASHFGFEKGVEFAENIASLGQETELARLRAVLVEVNSRLVDGRYYLMSVDPAQITAQDALEAFGFGRDGMQ